MPQGVQVFLQECVDHLLGGRKLFVVLDWSKRKSPYQRKVSAGCDRKVALASPGSPSFLSLRDGRFGGFIPSFWLRIITTALPTPFVFVVLLVIHHAQHIKLA